VLLFGWRIIIMDLSLVFILIDDLIDEVTKTEENLIITHTIN
jgi:hypothetical protein